MSVKRTMVDAHTSVGMKSVLIPATVGWDTLWIQTPEIVIELCYIELLSIDGSKNNILSDGELRRNFLWRPPLCSQLYSDYIISLKSLYFKNS